MNCFQFFIFAVLFTVLFCEICTYRLLWIAFQFFIFAVLFTVGGFRNGSGGGCELLSVLYICGVIHSTWTCPIWLPEVVNCFQFFIFAVLFTVFARRCLPPLGCELLSVLYICGVIHSTWTCPIWLPELWIAFSSLYLRCYSQFEWCKKKTFKSCELLSVLYICGVIHSFAKACKSSLTVVNCFQFFIFAVLFTVLKPTVFVSWKLWIAFSSLYLRCYSQC